MVVRQRTALKDPALAMRLSAETALRYAKGADTRRDRPGHVRAASGLAWLGKRLAVIQDDANFVASVDPRSLEVVAFELPAGADGARQFDDARGNKAYKLDLESCIVTSIAGREALVAFGSGSTTRREQLAVLDASAETGRLVPHERLYAALRACGDFAGHELNVEGAVLIGDRLRLFQRGNGASADGTSLNATVDVDFAGVRDVLEGRDGGSVVLGEVTRYALGALDGVALTFTDATLAPGGRVLFLATAEASPDAVRDGPVAGSVLGVIDGDVVRHGAIVDTTGAVDRRKAEGILLDPSDPRRAFVVFDADDPDAPAILATATLSGPWW
jgi:hypothetical protein